VAAELEDATSGNALWSRTFEVPMRDLPSLADSVARAIAERLGVGAAASVATRKRDESRETHDAVAYDAFLQGKLAFDRLDFERATRLFGLAVERDPSFARAHAWLALTHANRVNTGVGSQDSALAQARESSVRALALDSTLNPARLADAIVLQTLLQFRDAEAVFHNILAMDSSDVEARAYRSGLYYVTGRLPEASRDADASLRDDPLNVTAELVQQNVLYLQRRYDEALKAVDRILALDPSNLLAHVNRAGTFAFMGLADSAVAEAERAYRIDSTGFGVRGVLALAYATANRWRDVDRVRAISAADRTYNSPQYERLVFALIDGDDDAAVAALERGFEHHEPALFGVSFTCDPIFDPLHDHPRFIALARRYELRECQAKGRWPIAKRPGSARSSF
jgi:tetratricopeptide (TPR) repeat protein